MYITLYYEGAKSERHVYEDPKSERVVLLRPLPVDNLWITNVMYLTPQMAEII